MKLQDVKRFVKCDVCGKQQDNNDERGSGHRGHTMIVVSVYNLLYGWPKEKDKRRYYDVCSMHCLAKFASDQLDQSQGRSDKQAQGEGEG